MRFRGKKAVGVHAVFLVAFIIIIIFFAVVIFANWIPMTRTGIDTGICFAKQLNFCGTWSNNGYSESEKPAWKQEWTDAGCSEPIRDDCLNVLRQR